MYKLSVFIFLFFSFLKPSAQDFSYKDFPSDQIRIHPLETELSDFIKIVDYLPKNFVTDASVDYTTHIQHILSDHRNVLFPDFPLLVNDNGLSVKSNSILYFGKNSELVMEPNAAERYEILRVHNESNVKILNPKLRGDRKKHLGKGGQWGMGIAIRGAMNVEVVNPQISDCWGDGIYIGQHNEIDSYQIIVRGGILDNNRRNGISITSGTSINIEDILISNTNGQNPRSGIDVEPNNILCNLSDIILKNINTFNNDAYGILISLHKYYNQNKRIGISIENHIDDFSRYGFSIFEPQSMSVGKGVKGIVKLSHPRYSNNKIGPFKYTKHNFDFDLHIIKPHFSVRTATGNSDRAIFFINKLEKGSRNHTKIKVDF